MVDRPKGMTWPPPNKYHISSWQCAREGCSEIKKKANHWFILAPLQSLKIDSAADSLRNGVAVMLEFDEQFLFDHPDARPVCGQDCAMKVLMKAMTEGKL